MCNIELQKWGHSTDIRNACIAKCMATGQDSWSYFAEKRWLSGKLLRELTSARKKGSTLKIYIWYQSLKKKWFEAISKCLAVLRLKKICHSININYRELKQMLQSGGFGPFTCSQSLLPLSIRSWSERLNRYVKELVICKFNDVLLELVPEELNHLAAILHAYAGGLNFMK